MSNTTTADVIYITRILNESVMTKDGPDPRVLQMAKRDLLRGIRKRGWHARSKMFFENVYKREWRFKIFCSKDASTPIAISKSDLGKIDDEPEQIVYV